MPLVYAARWKAPIPHAEVAILEGAGHMLPYERPDDFASAVRRFLG